MSNNVADVGSRWGSCARDPEGAPCSGRFVLGGAGAEHFLLMVIRAVLGEGMRRSCRTPADNRHDDHRQGLGLGVPAVLKSLTDWPERAARRGVVPLMRNARGATMSFANITTAGAGTMGSQVAWQMAFNGKHVTVYDAVPAGSRWRESGAAPGVRPALHRQPRCPSRRDRPDVRSSDLYDRSALPQFATPTSSASQCPNRS